ncbi:hypothetical protein Prum_076570 [Phytohabitans rumicis]|uniref:non-specific serine/threonine protein kinase n=2 Tax=Phytohabitans rumicis TaxID=1076125 RepID=A0A6V8LMW8_9ACTN|nr:hypothetical protein Prum_076570 [Phytohabitans rumicis]
MGRVWLARDEMLRRDVAIKELVPPPGLTDAERRDMRERSMREARAIAQLNQSNVVRIFDVLHDGGEPWIVMELVVSRSLHAVVAEHGPMAPAQAARIGLAVLAALRAAHQAGLLHRDVKPANVLLANDGRVVLTDFGLATAPDDPGMTRTGVVIGSPSFLAPERATDGVIGPAADLWSLGATLYAVVEGRPPYVRSSGLATLAALATEPPAPPRRAGALGPALEGLLRKDPALRIGPEEAEHLLRQATLEPPRDVDTVPVEVPPAAAPRKRRGWVIAAVVAALALAGGLAGRPLISAALADKGDDVVPGGTATPEPTAAPGGSLDTRPAPSATAASPSVKPTRSAPSSARASAAPSRSVRPTKTSAPTQPLFTDRPIVNESSGKCIDVPGSSADTPAEIQMWDCHDVAGEKFTHAADGTLRVLGKCLEIRSTGNGSTLRIAGCTAGARQQFDLTGAGNLISRGAGRCVDVTNGDPGNGIWLMISDCTGTETQKWYVG